VIGSPHLDAGGRYERRSEGWVDNTHDDAFTHTVRLEDGAGAVELSAVCTPSPGYEIREARARALRGAAPGVAAALGALAGVRMVAGFTRRLADLCAAGPGAHLFVDAGIEIARLARQTAKLPAAAVAALGPGDAARCWELDTTGWVDLPDSCFTYSAAGQALLAQRPVTASMVPSLYSPAAGQMRVFERRKLARLVQTGDRLHLFHAMHDNVHGFDVHYEVDLQSGRIVGAESVTSRLPYAGLCSEPQGRIESMIGQPVDAGLRRRIQTLLGGNTGCAQLYDLTADLLKLLRLS
jgi:hypothetical protein